MTSKLNLIFIYIFFAIINSPIIYFVVYFSIGLKEQAIEIFIDRPIYIYILKNIVSIIITYCLDISILGIIKLISHRCSHKIYIQPQLLLGILIELIFLSNIILLHKLYIYNYV